MAVKTEKNNKRVDNARGVDEAAYRLATEDRLERINECFLSFGPNPDENINRLVSLCGRLLKGDCALYNRLEGGMLYSVGKWNTPPDFIPLNEPQGRICYDVIMRKSPEPLIVSNLQDSPYARTDPNVTLYKLKGYIGMAVKFNNTCVGSLCVVSREEGAPGSQEIKFMKIIASAIGVEENRRQSQQALEQSQDRYKHITETVTGYIFTVYLKDTRVVETVYGPTCVNVTGYTAEEFVSGPQLWIKIVFEEDKPVIFNHISTILSGGRVPPLEHRIIRKDGIVRWIRNTTVPHFDGQGRLSHYDGLIQDITEQKSAQKQLEALNEELVRSNKKLKQLALRDSHTGLYNHKYLEEVIETEFYRARRCAHALSVIMLDTDYFKSINDVYGYQFGDLILKQLARQLKMMVRRYDILVRFGGEEFVIVCPCTGREQALILGRRLLEAVNLYNFGDLKQIVKLKLSLAAVSYPEDNAVKGMDLINIASEILNKAKESGGNRVYSSLDIKKKEHPALAKNGKDENVKLLKGKLDRLTKRSNQSLIEAIFAFAKTIELKDRYTGEHVEKTVHYATEIARDLGLTGEDIESIRKGAMLHDLGKIGISEKILLKRAKLTKEEFELIKKHPQIGVDIIRPIQFLHNIIPLMLYHHERWDGKGYPTGLKGEEIPIGARIIAIADVYQALTSDRPYRKAFTKKKALNIIKDGSGTQFDPRIAQVFLKIVEKK